MQCIDVLVCSVYGSFEEYLKPLSPIPSGRPFIRKELWNLLVDAVSFRFLVVQDCYYVHSPPRDGPSPEGLRSDQKIKKQPSSPEYSKKRLIN